MRSILKYLKGYKAECFFAPFFKLLEACFDLFVPLVVTSIIDVGIANGDTRYIYSRIAILVALGIIGLTCAICAQYFAARAAVGTSTALRKVLFSHLGKLSYSQTDNIGTSTMVTRMTSDINQVQTGVNMTLRLFLRSPIIVFGAMIMAFTVNKYAASVFCILIPVLAVIVFAIILAGIPIYKKVQSRLDRVTSLTRENLSGVRVIRAFNLENKQTDDFVSANRAGKYTGQVYDFIYGPAADDDVYTTFTLYTAGVLTKEQTIETLKVKKLYNQLVLTSKKALGYLNFIGIVPEEEF